MEIVIQHRFLDWWKQHEDEYDLLLLDADGTLARQHSALPGADELLVHLENRRFPWYILTNDSTHSHREKSRNIAKSGLTVPETHLVSCSDAIRDFVRKESLEGETFFRAGYLGDPDYGEAAGLDMTDDPQRVEECRGFILADRFDRGTTPGLILNAFLSNQNRYVIVPNPDSYWAAEEPGKLVLGSAPVVKMLQKVLAEKGIRMTPHFLGKPHHGIFDHALSRAEEHYGLAIGDRGRVLMLGDSVHSDIPGAARAGMDTALVLTGVTHEDQLPSLHGDSRPSKVFRTIA